MSSTARPSRSSTALSPSSRAGWVSRALARTHSSRLKCRDGWTLLSLSTLTCPLLCPAEKLQGLIDKAEGPEALPAERKEMEELKALLPEIQEKVEDATEGLQTASTDAEAMKGVLVSRGAG